MKKIIEGYCALCGKYEKLSFEHVPPQSAFNNKPIFVQTHEHLIDKNSYLYGKRKRSNRGLGGYSLCESCNKNTGDWYARDFGDFAHQGMKIIKEQKGRYNISGEYNIKPLNVIKQILTMFMSADKLGILKSQKDLVDFILTKQKVGIPERYRIFLYSTLSPNKRIIGYTIVSTDSAIQKWSEISFPPFGFLLAEESEAAHNDMCDISSFGKFNYNEQTSVEVTSAYLNVNSPLIGDYR